MKKLIKSKVFLLVIILCIAFVLRFYKLGAVPSSLNWDEVSLGYNAYSILQTGRDEYGKFMPLVLQSYDDYKPALYVYFTIPFVVLFGLTEFAVRAPSATAGVLAVLISYLLVLELFGKRKLEILDTQIPSSALALVTAFLLSISPWHLQFSRIAFESNVGLTINLLTFLLFLKGLKKPFFLPLAFALGAANIHMYQSERVFTPLLLAGLSLVFAKEMLRLKKWFVLSVVMAFIVSLPFVIYIFTNQNALLRAKGVSIYSSQQLVKRASEKLLLDRQNNDKIGLLLDNRRVDFVKATTFGYVSHFDPNWLFITGDIARHHAPDMGLLYIFELPFLLLGIYIMVFLKIPAKYKAAFFVYFFLVPVPASITSGVPHAVRTLNFLPTFQVFTALGIIGAVSHVSRIKNYVLSIKISLVIAIIVYCFLSILNIGYYLNQYFVQQNILHSREWLYGYKQAIQKINDIEAGYDKIIVENLAPLDQSYMFFLFYEKVDPRSYQSAGGTRTGGFAETHSGFGKYTFAPLSEKREVGKVLLVGSTKNEAEFKQILYRINAPDGQTVILIGE